MIDDPARPGPDDRAAGTATGAAHVPVLLARTLELLAPAVEAARAAGRTPVVVDGTLGLGGHTSRLLAAHEDLHVVGVDRDLSAHEISARRLAAFRDRFHPVHARFDDFEAIDAEIDRIDRAATGGARMDGVLLDFGVSSMQLDQPERGFAYSVDAPLDMRMDPSRGQTAAEVLATYDRQGLARILRDYGEERFARQIASAVVRERDERPFTTTAQLVDLLYRVIPAGARRTGGHPAKRVFQALRIEVNAELEAVENVVPGALDRLPVGGRAVFLSYQSLEDRIVKRELATRTSSRTPAGLPVELPGHGPQFRLLNRGAEKAGADEVADNPRAASVRLRSAERLDGSPS